MPAHTIAESKKNLAAYGGLLKRVRETIRAGKERALAAVERESVRTKWEVGKLILEHLLFHKERADYGQRVTKRLSADLGISHTELRYMVEFARTYPIRPSTGGLSWAHHRELLSVNDPEIRLEVARKARQAKWSEKDLRREIKERKASRQITVTEPLSDEPLVPMKGKLDTYRIITAKAGPWTGESAIDLGFSNYHRPLAAPFSFHDKEIVALSSTGKLMRTKDASEADLFTYRAWLLQVTDADTLWVLVDLGFGFITRQQLRLRGLDAPEITSRAGQEAKRFVERRLKDVSSFVITSTKSDKYDRYLVDVFYTVKGKEHFLNNRLLERGLAERV